MIQFYLLTFLFIALLLFILLQAKQYLATISSLVETISKLKAFSMGMPPEKKAVIETPVVPVFSDADFGDGEFKEEEEEVVG